jgi:hypothetical protein
MGMSHLHYATLMPCHATTVGCDCSITFPWSASSSCSKTSEDTELGCCSFKDLCNRRCKYRQAWNHKCKTLVKQHTFLHLKDTSFFLRRLSCRKSLVWCTRWPSWSIRWKCDDHEHNRGASQESEDLYCGLSMAGTPYPHGQSLSWGIPLFTGTLLTAISDTFQSASITRVLSTLHCLALV